MTYLIVGNRKENIQEKILELLSKYWQKEVTSEIFDLTHPDIHVINGEVQSSIGIEEIKDLQNEMVFTPFEEKVQVAIINQAEKLTTQAQNSMLKTLEESSDTTAYILVVRNEKSLLPTILSRCSKVYTKEERDVQEDLEEITKLLNSGIVDIFKYIEVAVKEKYDIEKLLKNIEIYFQNSLEDSISNDQSFADIAKKIDFVHTAQRRIRANGNKKLVLENLFLSLRDGF